MVQAQLLSLTLSIVGVKYDIARLYKYNQCFFISIRLMIKINTVIKNNSIKKDRATSIK